MSKLQALDLRDLTLRKVVLRASDVEKIGAMANLRRAYLGFNEVNLDPVATLPKLAVLHVEGGITSAALPTLCSNPNLFRLRIHLDRDGEQALAKAPVPVGLRELELDSVSLSAKGAAALAEWPLAGLSACSGAMFGRPVTAQLGSDGAKELARCKTLEWLNVGAHDIGPDGAKALGTLPRLRWLHMPGNPIGAGVSGFAQAPALRVAYLNNCGLPPETPKWLGQVATLEEAYLWNNAIDGSHLDEFAKLPKLRELNLANNPVAPAAAEDLRRLAPHVKIVAPRPGAPDPTAGLANTAVVTINGGAFRPGSGS